MNIQAAGGLRKMQSRLVQPVEYLLPVGEETPCLNDLLGKSLQLKFSGEINCVHCGRQTKKSFNQGFCYPCFKRLAQCDSCIIHPEKCHWDQGTCREPGWGERYCMQDHIVYLANSSGLKVGITRATQVPTRWIDQGASQALAIIRVRSRLQSGTLEVMFKQHVADKTNWRELLKREVDPLDLTVEASRLIEECADDLAEMRERFGDLSVSILNGIDPVTISYPVQEYPEKIVSHNPEKNPVVAGTLIGIKGQYLLLDTGVINIRRFGGYQVELSY